MLTMLDPEQKTCRLKNLNCSSDENIEITFTFLFISFLWSLWIFLWLLWYSVLSAEPLQSFSNLKSQRQTVREGKRE